MHHTHTGTHRTDTTGPGTAPDRGRRRMPPMLSVGLWDIGLPVAAYYGLQLAGAAEPLVLLAAAGTTLLRVGWTLARERRFDGFAGLMGLVFGIGLGLYYVTGDERIVMASKSVTTLAIGGVLFASLVVGRPAAFGVALRFGAADDDERARWRRLYDMAPDFRRIYVVTTTIWAAVLLAESIIRIAVIYLLPRDVAVPCSYALLGATIAFCFAWASWYGKRGERRATGRATG